MAGGADEFGALAFVAALSGNIAKDNHCAVIAFAANWLDRDASHKIFVRLGLDLEIVSFERVVSVEDASDDIAVIVVFDGIIVLVH